MEMVLPAPIPKRLNVGCGSDIRPGFLNVDFVPEHKPDLIADVTELPMLPSGYFDEILAQDVLEHFERSKTSVALAEWARLLSDIGTLRIRVPSMFHMIDLLAAAEPHGAEAAANIVQLIYGTQAYTGDYHLAGFTPSVLQNSITSAGLAIAGIGLHDEWLFDITAGRRAVAVAPEWPRSKVELSLACSENLRSEFVRLQVERDDLAAERDRLAGELASMVRSTSWRITAPLRAVRNSIRGRRR